MGTRAGSAVRCSGAEGTPGKDGVNGKDGAAGLPGKDGTNGTNGAAGLPGKDGLNGANGTNGTNGAAGPAGPALATPAVSTRTLGVAFQPHATKPVFVSYSVKTQVTNPLLAGASTATVTLLSDAANPPTTERARDEASSSVGLAVSVALTTSNTAPLTYIVPAGHYVKLVSTVVGTGSTAIASQVEEVLG